MSTLFRDEVVQKRLSEIGVPLGITSGWMKLYTITLIGMLIAGGCAIAFGSYARKARVAGFLVPDKGLIKALSPREGRITERKVVEGDHVAKDSVLFVVDVGAVTMAGRTADLVVQNLRDRRQHIVEELARLTTIQAAESAKLDETITSLKQQLGAMKAELATRRDFQRLMVSAFNRTKTLETREIYSVAQREKAEQEVVTATMQMDALERARVTTQGDLAQAEAQKRGIPDRQANDRSLLERSLAEADQQILQIEEQRFLVVRASEAGTVTRVTGNVGSMADPTIPLLTIVPDDARLEAFVYVPSSAAGFVKTGAKVLLRYDAYPYQKFGVQNAHVVSISRTSVSPKELPFTVSSEEPLYLVMAELAKDSVTAFGREESLQAGAKFQADLVLEERRLWEWIIEPLLAARATL
jgi:membrane fusion protein